jgi:hypothetical protein
MLLITALAVAGCGSGSSSGAGDSAGAGGAASDVDIQTLAERFTEFRGRIVIAASISGEGSGEGTLYFDPPRYRTDFGAGGLSVFTLPEGTYFCSELLGDAYCDIEEDPDSD